MPVMLDVFIHSLLDSLTVLLFVLAFHVLLSFFEGKVTRFLESKRKAAPALGAAFGLIPECGTSVVAADLFLKGHISLGTVVAVFLSCSDEALPILFSDVSGRYWSGFLVIGCKLVIGTAVGLFVDLLYKKGKEEVKEHLDACEGERQEHFGCCHHQIEGQGDKWEEHLLHPLIHSLKIFVYVFIVTFLFATMVFYVGEDAIGAFLTKNFYLAPILGTIVGLIPNCASSVLLSTLFVSGSLSFAGLLSGLLMNAGLGMIMLFKKGASKKKAFLVLAICLASSIAFGYCFLALPF